jgi:uncharacterized membrane protein
MSTATKICLQTAACFLIVGLLFSSCKHETPDAGSFDTVCFETEILPVFQNSCATSGCHSSSGHTEGFSLDTYASIVKHLTPFDGNSSKIYRAITGKPELMPPGNALSKDLRTKIWLWIEQGAQETNCSSSGNNNGVKSACFERDILPVLQNSCAISKCHDATTAKEGLVLSSYTNIMKYSGFVKAGNPVGSNFYHVITTDPSSEHFMPPKPYSALGKSTIDSIYSWIAKGALNQVCAARCDTSNVTYSNQISRIVQSNCYSCHSGSAPNGGIKLTTYTEVSNTVKTGVLIAAIKRQNGVVAMPPSGPLATCDIRSFELWKQKNYPQ